jgi:hypothetical protein
MIPLYFSFFPCRDRGSPGEFKEVHTTNFRIVACKGESDKGDFVGRDNGPIALVLVKRKV